MPSAPALPRPAQPWWHPEALARRRPYLEARARVVAGIRAFFTERGFLEVETPCLQVAPGMEVHLRAFATELTDALDRVPPRRLYLHTSPEFAMKKLLAGGLPRIFQMARVFRNGDISPTHSPEFTMLEWYRAGATYTDLMDDVEALFAACGEKRPVERLSVAEAFVRHCEGLDILGTVADPFAAEPPPEALRAAAARLGVHVGEGDGWEDAFFHIFLARIEPHLGLDGPVILYDWPACMAALSRRKPSDPRVCERFEVYVGGLELANAFGELTDAAEQRRRFEDSMAAKRRLYGPEAAWPVEEDFLAALEHGLPDPCAGIALGVDRLVMVLTGAAAIEDVLWAPVQGVRG